MADAEGLTGPAKRVRAFLVGFRWLSIALGLILTLGHRPNPLLYHSLGVPPIFTIFMVVVVEGILSTMAGKIESTAAAVPLIFIDVAVGGGLAWCFSMGYFMLGAVLPVAEAAYYFGSFAGFLTAIASIIFTVGGGVWHAFNVWGQNSNPTDPKAAVVPLLNALVFAQANQMVVTVFVTALFTWIVSSIRNDEGDIAKIRDEAYDVAKQLKDRLDDSGRDVRDALLLAETRQQQLDKTERDLQETKDELEGVHKELHEKKAQVQAMQQMSQKKEQQTGQVHKREVEELKAEIDQLHHLLDRVTVLVDITRELHKTIHIDETLLTVLQGALKLVRSQTGILFIVDEAQNPPELFPEAAAGPYQTFFTNYSFKIGEGVPGWVASRQQPVKIDNETTMVDGEPLSSLVSYEKSAVVIPLVDAERILGVLYLGR
ncbi:MAG TPA: GAF domain-containing protein, partial [Candidatus Xenobia bacterium]